MVYVVRHGSLSLFLTEGVLSLGRFSEAQCFPTLEAAKAVRAECSSCKVLEVSWVGRWIWPVDSDYAVSDRATYYRDSRECGMLWSETLAGARRFDTPAEAREAMKKRWPKEKHTKVYRVTKVVR